LPSLFLIQGRLRGINEIGGAICRRLFLGLLSETLGFELTNLGVGKIELVLRFEISTNRIGMATSPVANVAFEFADLLPKMGVLSAKLPGLGSQFLDWSEHEVDRRRDRLKATKHS